ncbi:MAG: cell division protein SepF [Candidatus Ranarchaeia archaeon]
MGLFWRSRRKKQNEDDPNVQGFVRTSKTSGKKRNERLILLKSLLMVSLDQIPIFVEELQNGNILVLNTEPMSHTKAQVVDRQRAIDQIRGACREIGGEVAQLGESYYIVVTPPSVKIWAQPKSPGASEEEPQLDKEQETI